MKFVYVLPGWEGSAADSRVLRDAISRTHGLKITNGKYYMADNGYPNAEGFLTPYKGVRYHLNEWSARRPQMIQEMIVDLMEHNLDNFLNNQQADEETHNDVIDVVQTTTEWTNKRVDLAHELFNEWRNNAT
ncbi:hypothetical protein ACS0TY_003620 [Phlomoides rotata]